MEATPFDFAQGNLPRPPPPTAQNLQSGVFDGLSDITTLPKLSDEDDSYTDSDTDSDTGYLDTEEGQIKFEEYATNLLDHINSFRNKDTGKWEFNLERNQDTEQEYRNSKIRLLRGLDIIEKSEYPLQEDIPEDAGPDAHLAFDINTPYFTDDFNLEVMESIHDQINFKNSALHSEIPIKSKDLETIMQSIEHDTEEQFYRKLTDLEYEPTFADV